LLQLVKGSYGTIAAIHLQQAWRPVAVFKTVVKHPAHAARGTKSISKKEKTARP